METHMNQHLIQQEKNSKEGLECYLKNLKFRRFGGDTKTLQNVDVDKLFEGIKKTKISLFSINILKALKENILKNQSRKLLM